MRDSRASTPGIAVLLVVAVLWSAATLAFGWTILHDFAREAWSLGFIPVEARAVSFSQRKDDGQNRLFIDYRYRIEGKELVGKRFYPTPGPIQPDVSIEDVERMFSPGAPVTAYVSRFDPSDAVVIRGFRARTLFHMLFLAPFLLGIAAFWAIWRRGRAPGPGEILPGIPARVESNGDWAVRAQGVAPAALASGVFAVMAFAAGFLLAVSTGGRPNLPYLGAAWIVVLSAALALYVWQTLRRRRGLHDWRYHAARSELTPPGGGPPLKRSQITGLVLRKSSHTDDGDRPEYRVTLTLRPQQGAWHFVAAESSTESFAEAAAALAPLTRFLEERLGMKAEEAGP